MPRSKRDYAEIIRALRAKANDDATTPEEKEILRAKADELEEKYGTPLIVDPDEVHKMWERLREERERREYNRMYHDDYNGYRGGVEDQEMPANAPSGAGRYGWSPDSGKYRRRWNPYTPDDQDLISPEFRYDWEE